MEKPKNIITPDYISYTTQQLSIGLTETGMIFSTASGFIYSFGDRIFLITNWHNVSGTNPLTNESLAKHAGIPDVFWTYIRAKNRNGVGLLQNISLYEDEYMTLPKWLIHPAFREKVDVVAIELEKSDGLVYSPINKAGFDNDILPEVGDDAFVIGYPFEEIRSLGLPIWKKASIATEPTVNEDQLPKILIDTATRPGLSGSPVIYQRSGIHKMVKGQATNDSLIGTIRGFLGVYSGRIGKGEIHAQLGIVWKKRVIDEIIEGNTKGDIEFQKGKQYDH